MSNIPITLEEFVSTMELYKKALDESEELSKALRKISPYFDGYSPEKFIKLVRDLLVKITNDKAEWIDHFVYESCWGEKDKGVFIYGKKVNFTTTEDLYKVLELYYDNE
ncbi:MAG: hypothetical protein WCP97_00610 [bacterium]